MQLANVPARRLALVARWASLVCETPAPALASGEASTTVVPLPVGAQVASLAIGWRGVGGERASGHRVTDRPGTQ